MPKAASSTAKKKTRVANIVDAINQRQLSYSLEVLFVDESPFNNEPYVHRGWFRKRHQRRVPYPIKRQSDTVFSALYLHPQRVY